MNRLGIWGHKTPFREFGNFIQAVERRQVSVLFCVFLFVSVIADVLKREMLFLSVVSGKFPDMYVLLPLFRGVGAMEIVAMDMKLRGMYIARQLSFTGVTFKIEEVPLSQKYINMYNKSVRLVRTCK